ncbi:MAG: hypothetical protein IKE89_05500 [Bacilli bacterium]|nr:hypothetical protein [Bacilli bacterium]
MILGGVVVPHPTLIIPDVGLGKEIEIQDTIVSYEEIAKGIGKLEADTIILISPLNYYSIDENILKIVKQKRNLYDFFF